MTTGTVTIPKSEYETLQHIAERYALVRKLIVGDVFEEPPTKDADSIMQEFRATGTYNDAFLQSLKQGLKDSAYFAKP